MSLNDRHDMIDQIEKAELRNEKHAAQEALSSIDNRFKYLEEQTDILQDLVCVPCNPNVRLFMPHQAGHWNARTNMIALGVLVLPGNDIIAPLSSTFVSTASALKAATKFDSEIKKIIKYLSHASE
jgi:hypothetical protein